MTTVPAPRGDADGTERDTDEDGVGRDADAEAAGTTRRTVLRRSAAAGGLALGVRGLGGVATGQESPRGGQTDTPEPGAGISTTAAITEQEEYEMDLLGFWVHLATELDPYEASVADQCPRIPWSDLNASAYDAYLIDREAEPQTARLTVYVNDAVDVDPGELFIINEVHPCDGPYVSIRIEQIGARHIQVGPRATDLGEGAAETPGATDGAGPGMGLPAAVAALLGGGWLARRIRDGE